METADDDVELTREDKLRLKALLKLLDKAVGGAVDRGGVTTIEPAAPTPEDFAELRARRRRRAHRNG
jgi:hypothetical protein